MRNLKITGSSGLDSRIRELWGELNVKGNFLCKEELSLPFSLNSLEPREWERSLALEQWDRFVDSCSVDVEFFSLFSSLEKIDSKRVLIYFHAQGQEGNSMAFVDRDKPDARVFSEYRVSPWTSFCDIYRNNNMFLENIRIPFTRTAIWHYVASWLAYLELCTPSGSCEYSLISSVEEQRILSGNIISPGCGNCHVDFEQQNLLPFVTLDETAHHAHVGFIRVLSHTAKRDMAQLVVIKFIWENGSMTIDSYPIQTNWILKPPTQHS